MRTSTGGVLATKSERKMLASTCLYSRYAWLTLFDTCISKHFTTIPSTALFGFTFWRMKNDDDDDDDDYGRPV